jgi:hypothetical protein
VTYPGLERMRRRLRPQMPEFFRVLNRSVAVAVLVAGLQTPFTVHFTPVAIAPWSLIMGGWSLVFGCLNAWWHRSPHVT